MSDAPTVSVVVPTYCRPNVLKTCLAALHKQTLEPLEILVCRRITDNQTGDALATMHPQERRLVREVVIGADDNFARSLDAGIRASQGELVALTDDDAEAPADWLAKLVKPFDDRSIAGVGGRDVQPDKSADQTIVGKVTWYGKIIGNHHLGIGAARSVDVLKGVNCCFRGELVRRIGVDSRLRGIGNVMCTELSICFPLRRHGFRLIYDPDIIVRHHVAPRSDQDVNHRGGFDPSTFELIVHNETLCVSEYIRWYLRPAYYAYIFLIGTRSAPGIAGAVCLCIHYRTLGLALRRLTTTLRGRLSGVATSFRSHRVYSDLGVLNCLRPNEAGKDIQSRIINPFCEKRPSE